MKIDDLDFYVLSPTSKWKRERKSNTRKKENESKEKEKVVTIVFPPTIQRCATTTQSFFCDIVPLRRPPSQCCPSHRKLRVMNVTKRGNDKKLRARCDDDDRGGRTNTLSIAPRWYCWKEKWCSGAASKAPRVREKPPGENSLEPLLFLLPPRVLILARDSAAPLRGSPRSCEVISVSCERQGMSEYE